MKIIYGNRGVKEVNEIRSSLLQTQFSKLRKASLIKIQALAGIRTLDLCDTGAALHQLISNKSSGRSSSSWFVINPRNDDDEILYLFFAFLFKVQALDHMIEKLKVIYFAKYGFSFPLSGEIIQLSTASMSIFLLQQYNIPILKYP